MVITGEGGARYLIKLWEEDKTKRKELYGDCCVSAALPARLTHSALEDLGVAGFFAWVESVYVARPECLLGPRQLSQLVWKLVKAACSGKKVALSTYSPHLIAAVVRAAEASGCGVELYYAGEEGGVVRMGTVEELLKKIEEEFS